MKIEVKISGVDEAMSFAKNFNDNFCSRIEKALNLSTIAIEGQAKINVNPKKDTGRLESSITHKVEKISEGEYIATVGSNVDYAPHIEYGTSPHFPPIVNILNWVKRKGIETDDRRAKSVAYAICKSISIRGTKEYPYLRPAFESKYDIICDTIADEISNMLRGRG